MTTVQRSKDCKAEADRAARRWEINVKDCKAEADTAAQSWETNVKDCKAEADTAVTDLGDK